MTKVVEFIEIRGGMMVARGRGRGNGELEFNGYRVSILQDKKRF